MRSRFVLSSFLCLACLFLGGVFADAATPPATTRAQAIATVRSIINRNAGRCQINRVRSISAANTRQGWRVTARLVMSASGRPLNETAVWTVKSSNGQAVPNNQLTAEISIGCP